MLNCQDVANYFLILVDREAGDLITQLKLQKLVYFAQGVSLAMYDSPLFKEKIEAWEHGPVVRELRKTFGEFGSTPIPPPGEMDFDIYTPQQKNLIFKIYSKYGEHTASSLRNLTHEHSIWKKAHANKNQVIENNELKVFFKNLEGIEDFKSLVSEQDEKAIMKAEDFWWMSHDSGVYSENISGEFI